MVFVEKLTRYVLLTSTKQPFTVGGSSLAANVRQEGDIHFDDWVLKHCSTRQKSGEGV